MRHGADTFEQLLIYALAGALAIAFAPDLARSGGYETHGQNPEAPRWSNDAHHEHGLIVRPGCVALPPGAGAEYVPGRDPWGRPVVPAEPPKGFGDPFPVVVEPDVILDTRKLAGADIELHAGRFAYDPATDDLTLNGRTWRRDCLSSPK